MVCGHLAPDLTGIADELLRPAPRSHGEIRIAPAPAPPPEPEFVVRRRRRHGGAPMQEPRTPTQERQPVEPTAVNAER